MLLLVSVLIVVVIGRCIVGGIGISKPAAFSVEVIHLLPCLLNRARYPLSGPGCERVIDGRRRHNVVVNDHKFNNVLTDMYPRCVIK